MKKMIVAATVLALAGASLQTATAGDREWATVGKILTGVAAVGLVSHAIERHPVNYSVTYSAYAPAPCAPQRVVCAPAPRVVYVPAPVVYYPQPVYVTPYSHQRVKLGFGHGRSNRGHGQCR
jgi:hypothetical protein